jgi:hypothetical protein
MTDLEVLQEFCERFGYDLYITPLVDGCTIARSCGDEYHFDEDGMLDD